MKILFVQLYLNHPIITMKIAWQGTLLADCMVGYTIFYFVLGLKLYDLSITPFPPPIDSYWHKKPALKKSMKTVSEICMKIFSK